MKPKEDEIKFAQIEAESRAIFSKARSIELSSSPYLASRIAAHLDTQQTSKGKLFFWRLVTGLSVATSLGLAIIVFNGQQHPAVNIAQSYVIHVDFTQEDASRVASAQVELPEGVYFASNNEDIKRQRKLKLPMQAETEGRFKLPFVLRSNVAGVQILKVHLYDEADQLVKEREIRVRFAKVNEGKVL